MLKKDLKEFDKNLFVDLEDKWGILTVGDKKMGCNSMAVSWGNTGILWGEKVGIVYIRKSRYTYEFAKRSDSFTLSFLPHEYDNAKKVFGNKSGRDVDKYAVSGLHKTYEPDYDGFCNGNKPDSTRTKLCDNLDPTKYVDVQFSYEIREKCPSNQV